MPAPSPSPGLPGEAAAVETRLRSLYPVLDALPTDVVQAVLERHAHVVDVPAGARLFEEGAPCTGFPLVLSGEVRVARGNADGRSIELYRVEPGELCVASTSCLFGQTSLVAHGESMAAGRLVMLDPAGFEQWMAHAPFRRFVFGIFAERLADLMALAEAVAFQRLDQRLAGALLGHGSPLITTHQALADELGTVREIITRLLKRFERAGWVHLGRERIEILRPAALRALSAGELQPKPTAPATVSPDAGPR